MREKLWLPPLDINELSREMDIKRLLTLNGIKTLS